MLITAKEIREIRDDRSSLIIQTTPVIEGSMGFRFEIADPAVRRELSAGLKHLRRGPAAWVYGLSRMQKAGALALLLLVSGCGWFLLFTEGYRIVPAATDKYLGVAAMRQVGMMGSLENDQYLESIAREIYPDMEKSGIKVYLLDNKMVNAFALPGGQIIICRGLVNESRGPDEVAGVIAHEIAHIEMRHGIRQLVRNAGISILTILVIGSGFDQVETAETLSEISGMLINLKYSRGFESDADERGSAILRDAGIGTSGLISLLERIPEEGGAYYTILSAHPAINERIERLKKPGHGVKPGVINNFYSTWPNYRKRFTY